MGVSGLVKRSYLANNITATDVKFKIVKYIEECFLPAIKMLALNN